MRRQVIAGNWKMNMNRAGAVALAAGVARDTAQLLHADVVICPPAVYLEAVAKALEGSHVGLGAQNMHFEAQGAFTGEWSASMLVDVGCKYVILGHSERRQYFGESSEMVNEKIFAALEAGLTPIVCLGETKAQRKALKTHAVIRRQFDGCFSALSAEQMCRVIIAYEPVWAIGTGDTATPEEAQAVHVTLRSVLESRYNSALAQQVRILYGGSVTPKDAQALLASPDIDGALVGGASLKLGDFVRIVELAPK